MRMLLEMKTRYRIKRTEDGTYVPQYRWFYFWPSWSSYPQSIGRHPTTDCYLTKYFTFSTFEHAAEFLEQRAEVDRKARDAKASKRNIPWQPGMKHEPTQDR